MKAKICKICLKSDILCPGCMDKLSSGQLSEKNLAVTRAVFKVCGEECEFIAMAEDNEYIVIVADRENMSMIIGRHGRNTRKLAELLGKKVRVIEKADEKSMAESILGYRILGINIVYSKENFYKIRIEGALRKRIRHDYTNILSQILGKKVQIVYE